jgi:hypothetical protein
VKAEEDVYYGKHAIKTIVEENWLRGCAAV